MKEILYPPGFSTENESLTPEQIEKFYYLIWQAKYARAYPSQSGYFVKTAGITKGGEIWVGGNKEYAHSNAFIHGETSVTSGLKDFLDDEIEIIAWYRDKETGPGDFGRPCGNCRDVLKEYCSPNLILLNGNENAIVYTRLKDFFFEDFKPVSLDDIKWEHVSAAIDARRKGNDVYLPEEKKPEVYGAVLVSEENGTMWQGSLNTNVGYDAVTPVYSALIHWKESYPPQTYSERHLNLSKLLVVSEVGIPHVFYRDRQAILEVDETLRRYTKNTEPLQVDLVHATKNKRGSLIMYKAQRTNVEEWLPHPFSPGAFRMDDVMEAQLKKLTGKRSSK